jgi:hypothetical protein
MRHAFARQFPRRFVGALCSRSVLTPTIGSTTRLDLVFDVLESHFPAACGAHPVWSSSSGELISWVTTMVLAEVSETPAKLVLQSHPILALYCI